MVEDFGCSVPLWNTRVEDRTQIRYYDQEFRNVDRRFRTDDTDSFRTSETGPTTATIETHARFSEPFAVPGDDTTRTIITSGTILDISPVRGRSLLTVVGTLVEPPAGAPATFTGHVTLDGTTTRHVDAAYERVVDFEVFADAVCRAATGSGRSS